MKVEFKTGKDWKETNIYHFIRSGFDEHDRGIENAIHCTKTICVRLIVFMIEKEMMTIKEAVDILQLTWPEAWRIDGKEI